MTLPKNWRRVSGGMLCLGCMYHNKRTGEWRYDKPESEAVLARRLTDAALFGEYDHRVATNARGPPETHPKDWKKEPADGEILTAWYENVKTGRTCKDEPKIGAEIAKGLSNAALNRETVRRGRPTKGRWAQP